MKTIPLKDVSSALMCAVIRLKARAPDGARLGRTAAYTQAPFWELTCRDRLRSGGRASQRRVMRQHFSPMHAGDMDRLLERTRGERGLLEVRRTWGAGYRAMEAEFRNTVLR